jgi:hypothetical protein
VISNVFQIINSWVDIRSTQMTPPLIAQVAQALNSPYGPCEHVCKVAYFILTSVDMLHESVPVQSWNVLCFGGQNGQVYEIAGDGTPFETFERGRHEIHEREVRYDVDILLQSGFRHRYGWSASTRSVRRLCAKMGSWPTTCGR